VEGLVRVTALNDDYYRYFEDTCELVGEATNRRYRLGQKICVTVEHCDRLLRTIDFVLAEDKES
jgi:ribonuclease R